MSTSQLLRLTDVSYADGFSQMITGADAVTVSQVVFDQEGDMPNDLGATDLFVFWGQFLDHDLSLTHDNSGEIVPVPGHVSPIVRSEYDPATGTTDARQQVNSITPEIDGSMIYGSDGTREAEVRAFAGGRLSLDANGLLPMTNSGMAAATDTNAVFLAGDVRANENPGLTSLHTLFAREHNHWADRLAVENPTWTDQEIFVAARSIVEAEIQKITYQDWLPHLVGDAIGPDTGFDASIDTQITNEFSTAAFRFGHTMVSSEIKRLQEDGATATEGHISVQDSFFNVTAIQDNGIDTILRGQAAGVAQMSDATMIDDLNFFLSSPAGVRGFSLAALNIMRARDHGLDTYVNVRAALLGDIDPATLDPLDFSIISSDATIQTQLATAYGTVHDVELWVGGLAEDNIPGTQLGAVFTHIVAEQFGRSRAGDQSFGQIDANLSPDILNEISNTTLADIMIRNSNVQYLQQDVFQVAGRISGDPLNNVLVGTQGSDLMMGLAGADRIDGHGGNDAIYGGHSHDTIRGGAGDDYIDGGRYHDRLFGDDGNDTIKGGTGVDIIYGGAGVDLLKGGEDADRLDGGTEADILYGETGNDILRGGSDDDQLFGGLHNDRLHGDDGNDTLEGGAGADALFGGRGDNLMNGGDDNDRIQGDIGSDTLNGDAGIDLLKGGRGDDIASGGTENDRVYGDEGNDTLNGDEGNDALFGGADNDLLNGGAGVDTLRGGDGDDTLNGGTEKDILLGEFGDDVLNGEDGDDFLDGGWDNDQLFGGIGNDTLKGNLGDDLIFGDEGNDFIKGGWGADTINGGTGDDYISGGLGGDHFVFELGSGKDTIIDFTAGLDTIEFSGFGIADYDELMTHNTGGLFSRVSFDMGNGDELSLGWQLFPIMFESDFVFT